MAAAPPTAMTKKADLLTYDAMAPIVEEAIARLAEALDLDDAALDLKKLKSVE